MSDEQEIQIGQFDPTIEVDRFFEDSSHSNGEQPRFVLLMGGYGSGKTTTRQQQFTSGFVVVDAGEIFFSLCQGKELPFPDCLEEPMDLFGRWIAQRAIQERRHIVTEVIGAEEEAATKLVNAMSEIGYAPEVVFVDCDPMTGWERNESRDDDWISAHHCEPFHLRWLIESAVAISGERQ